MPDIQQGRPDDGYRPFQLIGVVVLALLGFAVFFLSFLLAPLAILVLFYIGFATSDRNKRNGNGNGNGHAEEPPVEPDPPVVTDPNAEVGPSQRPVPGRASVTTTAPSRPAEPTLVTPGSTPS